MPALLPLDITVVGASRSLDFELWYLDFELWYLDFELWYLCGFDIINILEDGIAIFVLMKKHSRNNHEK
ncbi:MULTISPECIES: hypothetical protein [Spirulina sp. CCY15215]|uniref:hypothetical protein n=1 Tax=Spirulina sp. CCY15215 TaxID=2767591 RepID=UPI00195025DE|nr:hypothetical protein [Spirulina major]